MSSDTTDRLSSATTGHSDPPDYDLAALKYAEKIGVTEYRVNGWYMEYWTFYGKSEGWYFVRYDLDAGREVFRGANIPWDNEAKIPAFLVAPGGGLLYNYMEG